MDETFVTVAEVAELLKINQQTVRNWIDQGSLPAVRVGRRVRVKQSDLDRILGTGSREAEHGDAQDENDRSAGPVPKMAETVIARDRFAAALGEVFRVAASPDSNDLSSTLRALASAAENLAVVLDP